MVTKSKKLVKPVEKLSKRQVETAYVAGRAAQDTATAAAQAVETEIERALDRFTNGLGYQADAVTWIEENLGIELFSNQIEEVEKVFGSEEQINVLACRGAGKTHGIAYAILAYCILYPGLRVIFAAPKEKQAGRILKEMVAALKSKRCKVAATVDWQHSSELRMVFFNGSTCIALSAQERANIEGEHGHILVVDEAHMVPSYSMTNKLTPMVGMLGLYKIIKIGVSVGKNSHFYDSCALNPQGTLKCPWNKAEIWLREPKPLFYKGKQISRALLKRMPVPVKKKYFPDRPDFWKPSGEEVSTLDWLTQYELEWVDDILNFLDGDQQKALADGAHDLMIKGYPNEFYCAGLDTAQGSSVGADGTDETVLSIWKKTKDGKFLKVASFIWIGDPIGQMEEIYEIIKPKTGLFPCRMTMVDYSNIGVPIVQLFRKKYKFPIIGKTFGSGEPKSKLNWKNALFNYFEVQLDTGTVKYPNMEKLKDLRVNCDEPTAIQIDNMERGFWEWCTLQRIKGRSNNADIRAPLKRVEGEDGEMEKAHDDVCCADVMAVWALGNTEALAKDMDKDNPEEGLNFAIPEMVVGSASSSAYAGMATGAGGYRTQGQNPQAARDMRTQAKASPGGLPVAADGMDGSDMSERVSSLLDSLLKG
jgi:hypothetical protein